MDILKLLKESFFGTPEQREKSKQEAARQRIEKEAERRIDRALSLGVEEFIGKFWNSLKHYPSWFNDGRNRRSTPLISDAKELGVEKRDNREWRKIQITLYGKDYIFAFEEHNPPLELDDVLKMGTLELYADNKKVLSLCMSLDFDEYSSDWSSFKIEAFIEGQWVNDFKKLYSENQRVSEEMRKELGREDPDQLKKNFGIE